MPQGWSCRKATVFGKNDVGDSGIDENIASNEDEDVDINTDAPASKKKQEYMQEMANLLAMQKEFGEVEAASLRRSSRATATSGRNTRNSSKKDSLSMTDGLEYFLRVNPASGNQVEELKDEENTDCRNDSAVNDHVANLSSVQANRLGVEVLQEKRHEDHYSKLYQKYENQLQAFCDTSHDYNGGASTNVSKESIESFGKYANGSFPPYLGNVSICNNSNSCLWEIRSPFAVPALRWIIRGLVHSGHLTATEPMTGTSTGESARSNVDTTAGVIVTNDIYYWDENNKPFELLDVRELKRRKAAGKSDEEESEDEIEMSEYEKLRAERVARNAERLRALGLA